MRFAIAMGICVTALQGCAAEPTDAVPGADDEPPPPSIGDATLDALAAGALILAEVDVLGEAAARVGHGPGNLPDRTATIHRTAWRAWVTWARSRHFAIPDGEVTITRVDGKEYLDAHGEVVGRMATPALDDTAGRESLDAGEHLIVVLVPGAAPGELDLVGAWHPQRHLAALGAASLPDLRVRFAAASDAAGARETRWRQSADLSTAKGK
jgi:hypothetical protein